METLQREVDFNRNEQELQRYDRFYLGRDVTTFYPSSTLTYWTTSVVKTGLFNNSYSNKKPTRHPGTHPVVYRIYLHWVFTDLLPIRT